MSSLGGHRTVPLSIPDERTFAKPRPRSDHGNGRVLALLPRLQRQPVLFRKVQNAVGRGLKGKARPPQQEAGRDLEHVRGHLPDLLPAWETIRLGLQAIRFPFGSRQARIVTQVPADHGLHRQIIQRDAVGAGQAAHEDLQRRGVDVRAVDEGARVVHARRDLLHPAEPHHVDGSIGSGNYANARSLTHEVGHFLKPEHVKQESPMPAPEFFHHETLFGGCFGVAKYLVKVFYLLLDYPS